mgnify:CR=1 FL=1
MAGYHTEYSSMQVRDVLPRRIREHGHGVGGRDGSRFSAAGTDRFFRSRSGGCWFLLKVGAILFFYVWMRWTLPRYRYDQLMTFRLEGAAAGGCREPDRDRRRRRFTSGC